MAAVIPAVAEIKTIDIVSGTVYYAVPLYFTNYGRYEKAWKRNTKSDRLLL